MAETMDAMPPHTASSLFAVSLLPDRISISSSYKGFPYFLQLTFAITGSKSGATKERRFLLSKLMVLLGIGLYRLGSGENKNSGTNINNRPHFLWEMDFDDWVENQRHEAEDPR